MYDYAIDKYVPVRFFDYVAQKWTTEKPPVNLTIDEGKLIPGTGLTATQIAREGWGLQKSQNGGGTLPVPAPASVTYHRYGSRVKTAEQEQTFFDGIDVSLAGIATLASGDTQSLKAGLAEIAAKADQAFAQYSPEKPGSDCASAGGGFEGHAGFDALRCVPSGLAEPGKSDVLFELAAKEKQFQKALAVSLELSLQTAVSAQVKCRRRGAGAAGPRRFDMCATRRSRWRFRGRRLRWRRRRVNLGAATVTLDERGAGSFGRQETGTWSSRATRLMNWPRARMRCGGWR